jgi:hypothetical protein
VLPEAFARDPERTQRAARIGIGWHRETGDYAATVAALLNAAP